MDKNKALKIIKIYNWVRVIILIAFLMFLFVGLSNAQSVERIVIDQITL